MCSELTEQKYPSLDYNWIVSFFRLFSALWESTCPQWITVFLSSRKWRWAHMEQWQHTHSSIGEKVVLSFLLDCLLFVLLTIASAAGYLALSSSPHLCSHLNLPSEHKAWRGQTPTTALPPSLAYPDFLISPGTITCDSSVGEESGYHQDIVWWQTWTSLSNSPQLTNPK